MTLTMLCFALGAVLVLAGIFGGGFEVRKFKAPEISGALRASALLIGLGLLGLASMSAAPGARQAPLRSRVAAAVSAKMSAMEWDTALQGSDYQDFELAAAAPIGCQEACENDPRCRAWTYVEPDTAAGPRPRCWLKHAVPSATHDSCCVSGKKLS